MKRFCRTSIGKTLLFLLTILLLCSLVASAVLGIALVSEGVFYTGSEQAARERYLTQSLVRQGWELVAENWNHPDSTVGEDRGNAVWQVEDAAGKVLYRSESAAEETDWQISQEYTVLPHADGTASVVSGYGWETEEGETELRLVRFHLKEGFPEADQLALIARLVHIAWYLRYGVWLIAFFSLVLGILAFVALMSAAARRPDTEEVCPGALYRVPFDLLIALCVGALLLLGVLADELTSGDAATVAAILLLALVGACVGLGLCMSAAGRIKGHTLWRNTLAAACLRFLWCALKLLGRFLRGFGRLLAGIPLVWQAALGFAGLCLLEGIVLGLCRWEMDNWVIFWVVEKLVLFPLLVSLCLQLRRLQKGGEALAAGDLRYQVETRGLVSPLRRHGENLNSIAGGMSAAVEQRLRSERMKTELITNVSHDLKTPLTSIVSYAELIGREEAGSEKIGEYAGVLLRQSERLKRLIEDLVEASKAATGNLEVEPVPCEASVFLTQSLGEYEERLTGAGLTVVTSLPQRELTLLVDGRRMWRIFDNLLGNIVKYALAGTRAYFSLEQKEDRAVFTFKNTSREALNVPEEELMERFVRGDKSRSTEGSGLGLSIARSMAELQGGKLDVVVDGDLFKAILSFPLLE